MRVLLDTNAYTALMAGDERVATRVRAAQGVVMSCVVLGELLFGFRAGTRYEWNRSRLDAFLGRPHVAVAPMTLDTAERFALVAASLRRRGTPIATNDLWIAAHAMETGARLLSFDADFAHVEGLLWTHLGAE